MNDIPMIYKVFQPKFHTVRSPIQTLKSITTRFEFHLLWTELFLKLSEHQSNIKIHHSTLQTFPNSAPDLFHI